jgi:creatinine amidohydrolase/Fe(II)-dependent formamide hydrolase-like protein
METSIMLALHPEQVRLASAKDDGPVMRSGAESAGVPRPALHRIPDMLRAQPYYMVRNFDELSATGTLGSPSHASVKKGALFLDAALEAVYGLVKAFAAGELEFSREQKSS